MCSSGGPMADVDLGKLKSKKYKVICPSCQSDNVEEQ